MARLHRVAATLITTCLVSVLSSLTQAAPADQVIFSCKTASGKTVQFLNAGKVIHYRYGKSVAAPDLAFSVPRSASSIDDGSENLGGGSWWMTQQIMLKFNGNTYTGWWSYHRASGEEEAGIRVSRGDQVLAETPCVGQANMNLTAY